MLGELEPDGELAGKVIAITGGSAGIGLATARQVLTAGASVALQARDEERLHRARASLREELPGHPEIVLVPGDSGAPESVSRLFGEARERFGQLNGFVASAGSHDSVDLVESDLDEWRQILESNLLSIVAGSQAAVANLDDGGSIVLLGSLAGMRGSPTSPPYAIAKAGVSMLCRALAGEVGPRGIRVNCVSPGSIETELMNLAFERAGGGDERAKSAALATVAASTALGRIGRPEEVAELIGFLLSDRSRYLTGTDIPCDGGTLAKLGVR